MLRIHDLQQWFGLSEPAVEEALHDVPLYREFAQIGAGLVRLPDETTILRLRHLLERHDLALDMLRVVNDILQAKGLMMRTGTAVDATLISAPSSTKNSESERDPEMHQTKKGNQWHFGMKAHIAVDADSGLVHTVTTTAANEADIEQIADLLHGVNADLKLTHLGVDRRSKSDPPGLFNGFTQQQPKRCAGHPAHRLLIPPQVPLTWDGGDAEGSRWDDTAHALLQPREPQAHDTRPISEPVVAAAAVTPSAAAGAADETGEATFIRKSGRRLWEDSDGSPPSSSARMRGLNRVNLL